MATKSTSSRRWVEWIIAGAAAAASLFAVPSVCGDAIAAPVLGRGGDHLDHHVGRARVRTPPRELAIAAEKDREIGLAAAAVGGAVVLLYLFGPRR